MDISLDREEYERQSFYRDIENIEKEINTIVDKRDYEPSATEHEHLRKIRHHLRKIYQMDIDHPF